MAYQDSVPTCSRHQMYISNTGPNVSNVDNGKYPNTSGIREVDNGTVEICNRRPILGLYPSFHLENLANSFSTSSESCSLQCIAPLLCSDSSNYVAQEQALASHSIALLSNNLTPFYVDYTCSGQWIHPSGGGGQGFCNGNRAQTNVKRGNTTYKWMTIRRTPVKQSGI